jgi:hypothetical protein
MRPSASFHASMPLKNSDVSKRASGLYGHAGFVVTYGLGGRLRQAASKRLRSVSSPRSTRESLPIDYRWQVRR